MGRSLSQSRLLKAKAVINPQNKDDYCFLWAVHLGMLDLTQTINYRKISNIKKHMREQDVYANCLLEMPVGPMEKNFRQFDENPFIH